MPESIASRLGRRLASSSAVRAFLSNLVSRPQPSHDGRLTLDAFTDLKYAEIIPEGKNIIGKWTKVSGTLSLGYASTIGAYGQLMGGTIEIGRYCQFGPSVAIYTMNHPFNHLTSYVNKALFDGRLKDFQHRGKVRIGHDVWLGHGAIVLPDVVIGNGAIIGAGTIVTRDVPEYSIVAGNPGKILKQRFSDEIIAAVNQLGWWNLSPERLARIEPLFRLDLTEQPETTLKTLREAIYAND